MRPNQALMSVIHFAVGNSFTAAVNLFADRPRRIKVHPRSRVPICPRGGRGIGSGGCIGQARHFVLGCSDLVIAVDHKPLLKLFGDRCLEDIPNPRL